ncbi:MAG: PilW family protein [Gammaproteobacteria bacterium]|nr:PilW family protein [Gammaproteobacteria bacterium]
MNKPGSATACGFSLIELMVALAISSVLLLGLSSIFVSSSQSRTVQTALAGIHETGRFGLDQMSRHIRMTGSRSANWTLGPVPSALVATDGTSDSLRLTYQDTLDCNLVAAPASGFVTNVFDVVGNALRCNGLDLIDNVQEMQVFLGEDTDNDDVPNRLVAPGSAGLQMNRVVSINLNLLVASNENAVSVNTPVFSHDFWNTVPESTDTRIWREYSTTISLRNGL